jgi:hypothetical protein
MTTLGTAIQRLIDDGAINSMEQLLASVSEHKLEIVRNGRDYLGLRTAERKTFRIRFTFENPTRARLTDAGENDRNAIWIYALLSSSSDGSRKACYVGQTVNIKGRMRGHLRGRSNHTSSDLFHWDSKQQASIQVAILSRTDAGASIATQLEGYWLRLATEFGYEAPAVERWGCLPRPSIWPGLPSTWDDDKITSASVQIEYAAQGGISSSPIFPIGKFSPK